MKMFNKEVLEEIIKDSCDQLKVAQPMLFQKSSDISERTFSNALSTLMAQRIPSLHVNCEYNRMTDETGMQIPKRIGLDPDTPDQSLVFPNIIVHRQESNINNVLVIDIKIEWKNQAKENDFTKLESYIRTLHYRYGLYLEIGEMGISDIRWFQ